MIRRHQSLAALLSILAAFVLAGPPLAARAADLPCAPACSGVTLTRPNFSGANLAGAKFDNATLIGAMFVRAKLTGADFTGAKFVADPANPFAVNDFTLADLSRAKFDNAKFAAPTYFSYATLDCTDFSGSDLSSGNAIFGDEPLKAGPNSCRTNFTRATMSCDFIDDWHLLDLTNAIIDQCLGQLTARNFAGARMPGVNFSGAVLDGSTFAGANLQMAVFNNASLQCTTDTAGNPHCADLGGAQLQGALLNNANLTGASLYKAFLSNDSNDHVSQAATVRQSHLKNVNLASAQLSGVDFSGSNFYGAKSANPAGCPTSGASGAGFTTNCASAQGATMTGTKFNGAYLFGVDFTNAKMKGADFTQAVLVGANFSAATIGPDPNSGAATSFDRAYLQGSNLDMATLSGADLTQAFLDFRSGGNTIFIALSGANHNQFACGSPSTCVPPAGAEVCVAVPYPMTSAPAANTTITCPDGQPARGSGCGNADPAGGNLRWKSNLAVGAPPPGMPPGWYAMDATYTKAAPGAACNGQEPVLHW